jgi:recombination protein RecA
LLLCSCSKKAIRQKPVWVDVEGTLDKKWAESIGVTEDDYYFALGDNGEMCMNMAHDALTRDDCGLVIIDSLGALIPEAEFEAPLDDQFYAIQARLISRSVRKLKQRLIKERKREHPCALICANQVRANMGAMKFETKEKQPGGFSMEHEFSLLLKSTKKFLSTDKDKKYFCPTTKNALAARFSVYMEKYKIETFGGIAEYVRADKNIPEIQLKKGEVDDYAYVLEKAKDAGIIVKHSKGWKYFNDIAKKQVDIRDMWKKKPEEYSKIQKEIIDRMRVSIG